MNVNSNTWIVIPAYNEGEIVGEVIRGVIGFGFKCVVVDDCSSDDTARHASMAGAYVCRHITNLGQGAALQTGINFALQNNAQYVVTFDADGQHQAAEIENLLKPLREGRYQVALGSRFCSGGKALNIPLSRKVLLTIATAFTRLTSGLSVTDTHNGFRALTRAAATVINLQQNRMAHASEILSEIASHKLSYVEVPVTIIYNEYTLKKGQRLSNSLNILWESAMELLKR